MAWKLEGTYFESCSCDTDCPATASLAIGAKGGSTSFNPRFSWAA